jgi:hypothetical protein
LVQFGEGNTMGHSDLKGEESSIYIED